MEFRKFTMNDLERSLDKSEMERYARVTRIYIEYPRFGKISRALDESFELSRVDENPLCMMITGQTGVGKSYLIKHFLQKYPEAVRERGYQIPVLYVSMPLPAKIKGAMTEFLRSLHVPNPSEGTPEDMRTRLYTFIKKCKVRLIIIDEFQHLLKSGNKQQITEIADWVKSLLNETKLPMVLVGTPEAQQVLDYSPQLERRFLRRFGLEPFDHRQDPDEFRQMVKLYESRLEFPKSSGLDDDLMLKRLYLATRGYFGNLTTLLVRATRYAMAIESPRLELSLLSTAFEETLGVRQSRIGNPLEMDDDEVVQLFDELKQATSGNV